MSVCRASFSAELTRVRIVDSSPIVDPVHCALPTASMREPGAMAVRDGSAGHVEAATVPCEQSP
jgi:hypothetical protein